MTPDLIVAILSFATKFGIDAAIAVIQNLNKPAATIDDAIAALQAAKTKTAQQYLDEAKAALPTPPTP